MHMGAYSGYGVARAVYTITGGTWKHMEAYGHHCRRRPEQTGSGDGAAAIGYP